MKKSELKNIILKELKDLQERGLLLEKSYYTGECVGPSEVDTEAWAEIKDTGGCGKCPHCHQQCHSDCTYHSDMIQPDNQIRR